MAYTMSETVLVVSNEGLGQGEPELCRKVLATYFQTMLELGQLPRAVLFYTAGVKMVADDSPAVSALSALASAGVLLVSCRTCLEYYGLMDKVAVGRIGNMMQIIEVQSAAPKVITL